MRDIGTPEPYLCVRIIGTSPQGDGFHITSDDVYSMVIPKRSVDDEETVILRDNLLKAAESCRTNLKIQGQLIPSYNFNKRMDILLDIDAWIVRCIAPDMDLPRDIFAQYKSSSFLRPLDLSALAHHADEDEEET